MGRDGGCPYLGSEGGRRHGGAPQAFALGTEQGNGGKSVAHSQLFQTGRQSFAGMRIASFLPEAVLFREKIARLDERRIVLPFG